MFGPVYSNKDEPILTLDEQSEIVEWTRKNYIYFSNKNNNRFMQKLSYFNDVPKCVWDIKHRIFEKENLYGYEQEPTMKDSIGYMINGAQLHIHTDPNPPNSDLIHTRFNVYVQIPEKGGYPIYNNVLHKLNERTYICCRSGIDLHYCEKVEGYRERIVISFGLLIPKDRIKNIIYDY